MNPQDPQNQAPSAYQTITISGPPAPTPTSYTPPIPSDDELVKLYLDATPTATTTPTATPPSTPADLMALLSDDSVDEKSDEQPKEEKPKKEKEKPALPSFLTDAAGTEAVIADVSTWDDSRPRLEVHKLSALVQDGHRRNLDGSSTQGLSISQCGINQTSRSHGWFIVNTEQQEARITRGEIPVCPKCFPGDEL